MKRKAKLKGFTLIEMLIVMIIIGILALVLSESYITISKMALKIEQEKNISEESLVLTQIFQSISDEATIDYERYENSLSDVNGFTGTLYLTGEQWSGTKIYSSGTCLNLNGDLGVGNDGKEIKDIKDYSGCKLLLEKEGEEPTPLTANGKVISSRVVFKIIPYNSDSYYFENGEENAIINDLHQPGFRVFIHLYAPLYQPTGSNKIDEPLQLFFNLNV